MTSADLTNVRTSMRVKWTLPDGYKARDYDYTVFYGIKMDEIMHKKNKLEVKSGDTEVTIDKLASCENYLFVVAITGPKSISHVSNPISKATKYSPGAPPKGLKVTIDEHVMNITWNASCSQV